MSAHMTTMKTNCRTTYEDVRKSVSVKLHVIARHRGELESQDPGVGSRNLNNSNS